MIMGAFWWSRIGVTTRIASFTGADIEMDSKMPQGSEGFGRDIPKWLEGALSSIVDEQTIIGADVEEHVIADSATRLE